MFKSLDFDFIRKFFIGFTISTIMLIINTYISVLILIGTIVFFYIITDKERKWIDFCSLTLGFVTGDILLYNFIMEHSELIKGVLDVNGTIKFHR
jgi:hypothetical protein